MRELPRLAGCWAPRGGLPAGAWRQERACCSAVQPSARRPPRGCSCAQDGALDGLAAEAYSPMPGLVAVNKADMRAFITLASFFAELLPQLPPAAFAR